ncbi:MAG: hemerythrin family protein [Dehalococcoidia bacterium]
MRGGCRPASGRLVPEFDMQHKQIIKSINELHAAMQQGHGRDELKPMPSYLISYASSHFVKEEACMAKYKCLAAAANMAHKQFASKITAFQDRLQAEGPSTALVIALRGELAAWLSNHICRVDRQLGASVRRSRVGGSPVTAVAQDSTASMR